MSKKNVNEGVNRAFAYKESKAVIPLTTPFGDKAKGDKIVPFGDMGSIWEDKATDVNFFELNMETAKNKLAKLEGVPGRETFYNPSQAVLPLMSFLDRLKTPENEDTMNVIDQGAKVIFLSPDVIEGGLSDGMDDSEFDIEQILKGLGVESEHTSNPLIAKEITKDHLVENDKYYDYLEDMEDRMNGDSCGCLSESADESFESYYKKLVDEANKKKKAGFDWRKDAQIEQFEYKTPECKKTLKKDYTLPDNKTILYIEKNEK